LDDLVQLTFEQFAEIGEVAYNMWLADQTLTLEDLGESVTDEVAALAQAGSLSTQFVGDIKRLIQDRLA
jgi:hypothetical protein